MRHHIIPIENLPAPPFTLRLLQGCLRCGAIRAREISIRMVRYTSEGQAIETTYPARFTAWERLIPSTEIIEGQSWRHSTTRAPHCTNGPSPRWN